MARQKRAEARNRYLTRKIANQRGWNTSHLKSGGCFLEEQEIADVFEDIGLGLDKPDFLVCYKGFPAVVVECKNDYSKIDDAVYQARHYAELVNSSDNAYRINVIVGAAGEEDLGYAFRTEYLTDGGWQPLQAQGYPLTSFPSFAEIEKALITKNGETDVTVPSSADFITAAIKISSILRSAKIEPSLRPKVLGAMITAMYWGEIDLASDDEIGDINRLVAEAIGSASHFSESKKKQLIAALHLTSADFDRLAPRLGLIVALLNALNIRSVLQTDADFLGMLYEAFIRYGYDNNSLGIVFTPRHITRYCAELINVEAGDKVIDLACGSGGFLVASFERMKQTAVKNNISREIIRESLYGFDTNPTVWSLAALNMFFRGDGKSHIENDTCLSAENKEAVKGSFEKALLNPPFSQEDEPERDFINAALSALKPRGLLAVVVKSGILADANNALWRYELLKSHALLGVISLPGDLFYPTAVDTSIVVMRAHTPERPDDKVFMAKVWNDGFAKLKGKRVEIEGSQLPEVMDCFRRFERGEEFSNPIATVACGVDVMQRGAEFCPEKHLEQPPVSADQLEWHEREVEKSILSACTEIEGVSDEVLEDFPHQFSDEVLPYGATGPISSFFEVKGGKSLGAGAYIEGSCPYVSSGDSRNSIIRLVEDVGAEVFEHGGITVTCFGCARVQPWRFMARGNGGSSVRVLIPKYSMSYKELVWFAAQINIQRWRFFYGRMGIAGRLKQLVVPAPPGRLIDGDISIARKVSLMNERYLEILSM